MLGNAAQDRGLAELVLDARPNARRVFAASLPLIRTPIMELSSRLFFTCMIMGYLSLGSHAPNRRQPLTSLPWFTDSRVARQSLDRVYRLVICQIASQFHLVRF